MDTIAYPKDKTQAEDQYQFPFFPRKRGSFHFGICRLIRRMIWKHPEDQQDQAERFQHSQDRKMDQKVIPIGHLITKQVFCHSGHDHIGGIRG